MKKVHEVFLTRGTVVASSDFFMRADETGHTRLKAALQADMLEETMQ